MSWQGFIKWLFFRLGGKSEMGLADESSAPPILESSQSVDENVSSAFQATSGQTAVVTYTPADVAVVDRTRTQWEHGAWGDILALNDGVFDSHPEGHRLRLMQAVAHLQAGEVEKGRQLVAQSLLEGCPTALAKRALLSGALNSLARAHAVKGDLDQAQGLFHQSVEVGAPRSDHVLLGRVRAASQLAELGLIQTDTVGLSSSTKTHRSQAAAAVSVQMSQTVELGPAWASNTVNTAIYRHHAVLTSGQWQFTAFYCDERVLRVVRRNLRTQQTESFDLPGQYAIADAHNSATLGIDRQGCLHLCYDHHASRLRYRRGRSMHSISDWTDELDMTGVNEDRVTYPTFLLPTASFPLSILYRSGGHDRGMMRMKTYDESARCWSDAPQPVISGIDQKPWSSNAYWNHPVRGADGCLHLSFVWRIQGLDDNGAVSNTNICYARSWDNGLSWESSAGVKYRLPITPVTAEVIHAVPANRNLINQCSMALVDGARPVIAYYAKDDGGNTQFMALLKFGDKWVNRVLTHDERRFELRGKGTLRIPMSRPEVLTDTSGAVFVIFRAETTNNRFSVIAFDGRDPDFNPSPVQCLCDIDAGFSEPVIDRTRWEQQYVLTLYVQYCDQPVGDVEVGRMQSDAVAVDLNLNLVRNAAGVANNELPVH